MNTSTEYYYIGIIEINDAVIYINQKNNILQGCLAFNTGLIPFYEYEINDRYSLDENLENFIATLEQRGVY